MGSIIDGFLTGRDRIVFANAGYGRSMELGDRPALLIIDVTYEFTGLVREPILDAIRKVRTACGEEAWDAVARIRKLVDAARECGVPIVYTTVDRGRDGGPYARKNRRSNEVSTHTSRLGEIVVDVAPKAGDVVIKKPAPSAFFGTNLLYHLIRERVDTLVLVGGTTSGCVRASAVDAFSYGYRVAVVKDAVFDRGQASHAVNLFDLQAKYANLLSTEDAVGYFRKVTSDA